MTEPVALRRRASCVARIFAVAALSVGALGACSSASSPNAAVERARSEVVATASDPLVTRYARAELESAQDAFAQAERDWRRRADSEVIARWATVAEQRAATARETAQRRHAEEEAQAAEAERQQKLVEERRIESESLYQDAPAASGASGEGARAAGGDVVVVFADDQFQEGRVELGPAAAPGLDRIADLLRRDPQRAVRLESHVDDTGSRSRSIELSGRRAEAVRAALVARGVEARRIVVRALGDSYPVASNETELGRERNRRVEAIVSAAARSGAP
jgi:outer membrane protein OmpA-like peptidoglycan-associated protein